MIGKYKIKLTIKFLLLEKKPLPRSIAKDGGIVSGESFFQDSKLKSPC